MRLLLRRVLNVIESINSRLSLRAKMQILAACVILPIIADHITRLFDVDGIWEVIILTIELLLPSAMLFLLWKEIYQLNEQAVIDPLTRLLNRRGGEDALKRELSAIFRQFNEKERLESPGIKVAVAFIDVDHLKKINDSHGHQAGDKVIQAVGEVLRTVFPRGIDIVMRQGGDEFLVMVPQMQASELKKKLEDCTNGKRCLLDAIANSEEIKQLTHGAGVTLSIGIASGIIPLEERKWGEVLSAITRRADAALYATKGSGRNGIRIMREDSYQDLTVSDG